MKDERKAVGGWSRYIRQNIIMPVDELQNEFEERFNAGQYDKLATEQLQKMADRYEPLFWKVTPIIYRVLIYDEKIEPEPWEVVRKIVGAYLTLKPYTKSRRDFIKRLAVFHHQSQVLGLIPDFKHKGTVSGLQTIAAFYNIKVNDKGVNKFEQYYYDSLYLRLPEKYTTEIATEIKNLLK